MPGRQEGNVVEMVFRFLALSLAVTGHAVIAQICLVSGQVVDPSEQAVPEVAVSLLSPARFVLAAVVTDQEGRFEVRAARCGQYLLTASRGGFADIRQPISLTPGVTARLRLALNLAPVEETVTVTAEAGTAEAVGRVAQPVTVVARSAIAERTRTVLIDLAEGEPGVSAQRTSSSMGSFFVRGLTGKNVSVYRDGFRYTTSAQRGGVSTFQNMVDPSFLDSVEFLRGPNSALYGSDSLGGSVNLLSTFPIEHNRRWSGEATMQYDWASAAPGGYLQAAFHGAHLSAVATLAARRTNTLRTGRGLDSHSAVTRFLGLPSNIVGTRLSDSAFTQYGGSTHAQYRIGTRQYITAHYERNQQDGGKRYDQLLGGDGNLIADLRNLMLDFGYVRYQRFRAGPFDQVFGGISYNAQREERVNQGGQGNPLGVVTHQYERTRAWGATFLANKWSATHSTAFGGEGYREGVAAPSFSYTPRTGAFTLVRGRVPDGARYWSHGLYVQDTWTVRQRLRLSGSLRFGGASYRSIAPRDSLAANALTGGAGATVRLIAGLSARTYLSRGFRAPNITDLGTLGLQGNGAFEAAIADLAGRGATIGSTADDLAAPVGRTVEPLRPETMTNYDAGLLLERTQVRIEFTAFCMSLGNSIISQTLLLPPGAVGQLLGDQTISQQLPSGAVYVPLSARPVQVRANYFGARMHGIEQSLRLRPHRHWTINEHLTWIYAQDERTGLPPDIEPGVPALTIQPSLLYIPARRRMWVEGYATLTDRQSRLSSLALADRRIGARRSRANIANFFANGARTRGLVQGGRLLATGEALDQVLDRVLGSSASAPMFTSIPGYAIFGVRAGLPAGERTDLMIDLSNVTDRNYRGIGWGMDGAGRSVTIHVRHRF